MKNVLSRLAESAEEDRVDTGAILEVVDAGTEDTARSAIKTAAEDQRTFALIGLFETGLSRMAAENGTYLATTKRNAALYSS